MADLHLRGLLRLPAPSLLPLIVAFSLFPQPFPLEPGTEELGRVEVFLHIADDLCGAYPEGFVDSYTYFC
jgi:hypothetical protein